MSDNDTAATETEPQQTEQKPNELPDDHPLVKTLAAQKAAIKELKAKASRLDEIEEAQKSESEKAADRIAKAEAAAASVPAQVSEALRAHLVALHGIDTDKAELYLTATEPELLLKQVAGLVDMSDTRKKKNIVPREGNNPTPSESDERAFVRGLFGGD